ncbi:hypothetical protein DN069_38680 [Streptacidiphilus pinicola]|uniref:Berberine/berberine-like domain-containing protein n=1 Tax=Streptacidiphilus pinicola TaxID=2219663 RepID=A0A2X0I5W3_9ACTN|nr:hypothetical protein DN069_38680 [Streptacidiphilus pinicola]
MSRQDRSGGRRRRGGSGRLRSLLVQTFLNGRGDARDVASAYEARDFERLRRVKAVYDPENMFRMNHNIPPADLGVGRA